MSSLISIATFIRLEGIGRFQNAVMGGIKHNHAWDKAAKDYLYLPFLYQGATVTKNGDNLESALVLANNKIAVTYAVDAVESRVTVRVATCLMDNESWAVQKVLSTESWLAVGLSYDSEAVEVTLSSAVDAVGATVPNLVLTSEMVGALPTTGQIANR